MKGNTEIEYDVKVPENNYSVGLELEFFIRRKASRKKYFEELLRDAGEFDLESPYNLNDVLDAVSDLDFCNYRFGCDGAGEDTPEFRSPVFMSEKPEVCLEDIINFCVETQDYLEKDFSARYRPTYMSAPYGIHFSVGGRFLELDTFNPIITRSKRYQPKIRNLIPDSVIDDFNHREDHYPGSLTNVQPVERDINDLYFYQNGMRVHNECIYNCGKYTNTVTRVELRFFPSCFIESLRDSLRFLLLDTKFPTKNLRFSRK